MAMIGVVFVLLVIIVAISCILCYFSCDSEPQEPQGGPSHSFTVATFQQKESIFTGPSIRAQPRASAKDFWTFM